jgi:hypothetical protein
MPLTKATTNVVNLDKDTLINGLTVGRGSGNIASNTASGQGALQANTTGFNNTASGVSALLSNTIGQENTANGVSALISNTTGNYNTANGVSALRSNTTGSFNTASGIGALYSNTIGSFNTASGRDALYSNTTFSNAGGFGTNAQVVQNRSDIRDKADIRDTQLGLEFVNSLRPVDFKWDMREDYRPEAPVAPSEDATEEEKAAYETAKAKWLEDVKLANITHDGSKKRNRFHHGLIAQEVKAVLDSKGIDFGGFQDHKIAGGDDVLSVGYVELIAPMLKAIQELSAKVTELENKQ